MYNDQKVKDCTIQYNLKWWKQQMKDISSKINNQLILKDLRFFRG